MYDRKHLMTKNRAFTLNVNTWVMQLNTEKMYQEQYRKVINQRNFWGFLRKYPIPFSVITRDLDGSLAIAVSQGWTILNCNNEPIGMPYKV